MEDKVNKVFDQVNVMVELNSVLQDDIVDLIVKYDIVGLSQVDDEFVVLKVKMMLDK